MEEQIQWRDSVTGQFKNGKSPLPPNMGKSKELERGESIKGLHHSSDNNSNPDHEMLLIKRQWRTPKQVLGRLLVGKVTQFVCQQKAAEKQWGGQNRSLRACPSRREK